MFQNPCERAVRTIDEDQYARDTGSSRVLIVDDDPLSRELLREALEPLPCTIIEAHDGKQALDVLAEQRADLMFVDIQMPHMDGLEFLNRVRKDSRFAAIPVVAVTAYAMAGDDAWALEEGFDRYISKPISVRRLRETTMELLPANGDGDGGS